MRFVTPPEFAGPFKLRRKYFRRAKLRGRRARRGLGKFSAETGGSRLRKNRLRNFRRPVAFNSAMKTAISAILALSAAALLCSCESMGFSCGAVGPALTPDVDATTTERTWEKAPDSNREIPSEREAENPPAYR